MLGCLVVLYLRQNLVDMSWRAALMLCSFLLLFFAQELSLPANAFWSFFARYVVCAILITAVTAHIVPTWLISSELADLLVRVGILAPRTQ